MEPEEFRSWQIYIERLCGQRITAKKQYLLVTRLKPLLSQYGDPTYMDLLDLARSGEGGQLENEIIDALTTHETAFFRHPEAFDLLRKLARKMLYDRSPDDPLRILSAGCSSGEEVWSIAITLERELRIYAGQIQITGCDIADGTLDHARQGFYKSLGNHMTIDATRRFFTREPKGWRVVDRLREHVTFEHWNLLHLEEVSQQYDIIFCRNVAIYLTPQTRRNLIIQLMAHLKPEGYLIPGASEPLMGVTGGMNRLVFGASYYYQLES